MAGPYSPTRRSHRFIRWFWLALASSLWLPVSSHAQGGSADSVDFTLNTTGIALGIGGSAYADSVDFTVNTTGIALGIGGSASADSADFTVNTSGIALGMGGSAEAESADFTLNTTGIALGLGGSAHADSLDFTLNTGGAVDIGLHIQDGAATIRVACEPPGTLTSPLRIHKNGTTYGIILVDPNSPDATKIRIQTPSGVKALQKLQ